MVLADELILATIGKFLTFSEVQTIYQVATDYRRMKISYENEYGSMACICAECFTQHGWNMQNRSTHRGYHVVALVLTIVVSRKTFAMSSHQHMHR